MPADAGAQISEARSSRWKESARPRHSVARPEAAAVGQPAMMSGKKRGERAVEAPVLSAMPATVLETCVCGASVVPQSCMLCSHLTAESLPFTVVDLLPLVRRSLAANAASASASAAGSAPSSQSARPCWRLKVSQCLSTDL